MKKPDKVSSKETLSGDVPMPGHLSNHFVEGMRQIYELEPFIQVQELLVRGSNSVGARVRRAI